MRVIKGCNVAVVGGAGFLGSHLVKYLQTRDCRVLVIDNLITGHKEFLPTHDPTITFEYADITGSENYLLSLFNQYEIQYVFNYAASPYVPVSFERPLHVFDTNAFAALKVINAAQESDHCKAILQVSSAEIYGDQDGKISETDLTIPHSSYGVSKLAIDHMTQVRWKESQTPVIALRQFNCVGERETHPYVVPEIISQVNKWKQTSYSDSTDGTCTVKLGNNSFRDFQYAGDAVTMAVELLEKGEFGQVYNMGSETGIKIYDLARKIALLMGCVDAKIEVDKNRIRPWEIWHLQSDNSKLYSVIESRPQVSLDEALKRTIKSFSDQGCKWGWE